jgi:hypothetical protein
VVDYHPLLGESPIIVALTEAAMADEPKKTSTEYQLIGLSEDGKVNNLLSELNAKEGRQRLLAARR